MPCCYEQVVSSTELRIVMATPGDRRQNHALSAGVRFVTVLQLFDTCISAYLICDEMSKTQNIPDENQLNKCNFCNIFLHFEIFSIFVLFRCMLKSFVRHSI